MTTNKPGSIGQRPLYGCTSCHEEVSWPAEDLRVHEGECWCGICWDERVWDFEDQPQWGELDTFTPRPAVQDQIGELLTSLADSFESDLLALSFEEIAAEWYWHWDNNQSIEWNTYKFSDILDLHKKRWRRWEEHHNGPTCVVERVRDKYVMLRVREFLEELKNHQPRPAVQAVFKELHDRIRAMCGRVEPIGGQLYSYVQKDEVLGWIEHYAAQQPEGVKQYLTDQNR